MDYSFSPLIVALSLLRLSCSQHVILYSKCRLLSNPAGVGGMRDRFDLILPPRIAMPTPVTYRISLRQQQEQSSVYSLYVKELRHYYNLILNIDNYEHKDY
jgi:hypothetical protein